MSHIRAMLPRIIFFAMITLLLFAELWFSNLGALNNSVELMAALMNLDLQSIRQRLAILILLDAIGGVGALAALLGCLLDRAMLRRAGAMVAAIGLISYGLYQLFAAFVQLPPQLRPTIGLIGVIYVGIGIVAWIVGTRPTPDAHPAT